MYSRILLVSCLFLIALPVSTLGSNIMSVEEIKNSLTPSSEKLPKIRTRGVGGIAEVKQSPRVVMNLTFELNSAKLTKEDLLYLNNLGKALEQKTLQGYIYQLEGHTCDLGSDTHNERLSQMRAQAVKSYLLNNFGLNSHQIRVAWYGESRPSVPNIDEAARKRNRRVTIINTLETFEMLPLSDQIVEMETKYLKDGKEVTLYNGHVLESKQQYAVQFRTRNKLHLYIYQVDSTGNMIPLFPNSNFGTAKNPMKPGELQRVPEHGKWFYLDDTVGKEQIILLASQGAIEDPIAKCKSVLSGNVEQGLIAQANNSGMRTRGLGGVVYEPQSTIGQEHVPPASKTKGSAFVPDIFVLKTHFTHQ